MAWTTRQKLDWLIRQRWTIVKDVTPEGDQLLRVVELPAAVGCGDTDESRSADFWESFIATLEAYLATESIPPLPAGAKQPPWLGTPPAEKLAPQPVLKFVAGRVTTVESPPTFGEELETEQYAAAGGGR